jgi:hypothetical protein
MVTARNVFQLDELVDLYRVALSIDLEENLNIENTFVDVDVDVEELNDVLRTSGYTEVNKDYDSDEINVEYCDKDDDDEIDEVQKILINF